MRLCICQHKSPIGSLLRGSNESKDGSPDQSNSGNRRDKEGHIPKIPPSYCLETKPCFIHYLIDNNTCEQTGTYTRNVISLILILKDILSVMTHILPFQSEIILGRHGGHFPILFTAVPAVVSRPKLFPGTDPKKRLRLSSCLLKEALSGRYGRICFRLDNF